MTTREGNLIVYHLNLDSVIGLPAVNQLRCGVGTGAIDYGAALLFL